MFNIGCPLTPLPTRFLELWNDPSVARGDLSGHPGRAAAAQATFMADLWRDVVSFAGAVVIRRLTGLSHVADMDSIEDKDLRAGCERRALTFGRHLLVNGPSAFEDARQVVSAAVSARTSESAAAYWLTAALLN